jgi:uncharacterized membrane protein
LRWVSFFWVSFLSVILLSVVMPRIIVISKFSIIMQIMEQHIVCQCKHGLYKDVFSIRCSACHSSECHWADCRGTSSAIVQQIHFLGKKNLS